jgi:curli biogenesis system outer membrane secretion channel CsgG
MGGKSGPAEWMVEKTNRVPGQARKFAHLKRYFVECKGILPSSSSTRRSAVFHRTLLTVSLPCLISVMAPGAPAAPVPKNDRPRLVVLDFPVANGAYEGWHGWGYGGGETHISSALQELMTTALMDKGQGQIRLFERKQLEQIIGEQKLGSSGLVDETTAVQMGKLVGARYMVTGKVTRFAYKKSGFSTGWGVTALLNKVAPGGGAANEVAGDFKMSKATFTGRLDVRLFDVQTGEILIATKEEGTTKDVSCKVAGTGSDVQYDQELVNKIFEPVADKIAATLIKKIGDVKAQEGSN